MATQPIFAPYTPLRVAAPKPNIRVAFIAGEAVTAVHKALADQPAAELTLEELAIAGLTDELIAAGRELLSPPMFSAFLRWGEAASHFATRYASDEEGNARCEASTDAILAVAAVSAANLHDLAFKAHLLNVEAGDCSDFGQVDGRSVGGNRLPGLIEAVATDLHHASPVTSLIDQLATLAWASSGSKPTAIDPSVGALITSAFAAARKELGSEVPPLAPLPATLDGYSPFMRGPMVAWRKAYAVFEAATATLAEFERTDYEPASARYLAARGDLSQPVTPEQQTAMDAIPMDPVQERFDELLDEKHAAIEALLRIPAPSPAELATKLKILEEQQCWELSYAKLAMERITSDARRFGRHGAFLQTDRKMFDAFSVCRSDMKSFIEDGARGDPDDREADERVFAAETVLFGERPSTLEGVLLQLRVLFPHLAAEPFADRSLVNPDDPEFREGLSTADGHHQALWRIIEDLARIGGVNLAELGA